MDLRHKTVAVRNVAIWILNALGAVLLLWATDTYGKSAFSGDYLYAVEHSGSRITHSLTTQSSATGNGFYPAVEYQAFDGEVYRLDEHRGKHVSVLLPEYFDEGSFLTADHVEEMVDRLDLLYVLYREILKTEPKGSGPLPIAFVSRTCGKGCGLVGGKGIEVLSNAENYANIARELDAGRLETILVHEMAHNFDAFSNYLHYLPDHAHAWTDMFEFFAPYRYARDTLNNRGPDEVFNSPVRSVWLDYVQNDSANWERCVRNQACAEEGLSANNLWAMLYYRVESLHGMDALLRSFSFLVDHARQNAPPKTEVEKEGLRILSLSVGAGVNIACYMDALKWPVPQPVRDEMARRFGTANAFCADADGDGFTAVNGDCDDGNAARHIGASEIGSNRIDDDCDDLVDESSLTESELGSDADNFSQPVQVSLPFEVSGNVLDSDDTDGFRFSLPESQRVCVTLCAKAGFKGWAVALQPNGESLDAPNWFQYQPVAGCSSNTFDYQDLASGRMLVMSDDSAGDYSLTVSEATELPPDYAAYLDVTAEGSGSLVFRVNDRDSLLADLGADEIEFWISGAGIRLFQSYSENMRVTVAAAGLAQLVPGQSYQVRIRPRFQGVPLAAFSSGRLFRHAPPGKELPAVDHSYSGAWFDPEHEGEGFIVEVLENDQALVYWFTYHGDGRQRWLLGMGDVDGERIVIEQLMDSSGGRFGAGFNPDDVSLTPRGALTIAFQGCTEAIVNYSVDGRGGHQSLTRLSSVLGHGCGKDEIPPGLDLSGSWFDPSHDGEGFIVEQLDDGLALVLWFTYDAVGNQSWLLNTGTLDGGRMTFAEVQQPAGGRFGRSFDPATVERRPWGELVLELDCDGGLAEYAPTADGYSQGSQRLVPLTRLQKSGCSR